MVNKPLTPPKLRQDTEIRLFTVAINSPIRNFQANWVLIGQKFPAGNFSGLVAGEDRSTVFDYPSQAAFPAGNSEYRYRNRVTTIRTVRPEDTS